MARWGLISDVHGNRAALERAVDLLRAAGAERFAFLGDYLGRGDPDGCVRLIREVADVALVGNRDLDWQDRVAAESREWVLSLPRTVARDGMLLAHGDPRLTRPLSTAEIAHGFKRAWLEMDRVDAWLLAFGHSHHARVWVKSGPSATASLLAADDVQARLRARYVLNVGTTGLPFPGKGGPSVALVDAAARTIRVLPVPGARMPA